MWEQSRCADPASLAEELDTLIVEAFALRPTDESVPSPATIEALQHLTRALAVQNEIVFEFPEYDLTRSMTAEEAQHVIERLGEIQTRLDNCDRIRELFLEWLEDLLAWIVQHLLPQSAYAEGGGMMVPLYAQANEKPSHAVTQLILAFIKHMLPETPDRVGALAFSATRRRIWENILDVSELTPEQFEKTPHRVVAPTATELAPDRMISAYLGGTPLEELLHTPMPFAIPDSVRNEHFLMIARTGSGKTQFIQRDILDNLHRPDPPGMVVIDSQNQMIPKLERLKVARDRIVIIDPFDSSPPALNMFIPSSRDISDPNLKEAIEANTLQQFAWIFSALDQELTGRQTTLFTFTTRILFSMQSNMQTLLEFMRIEKPAELRASKFWPRIEQSDEQTRYFFENRFCTGDYNKTKGGLADRLLGLLKVPAFNRMFMAPANKLDLYTALAERKLILFNTHKRRLGDDASAILGRYAISLYIRAAFERELDRSPPPAFLYIDEASEYFGKKDSSDVLFTQLRKYNCGSFIAFQDLSQLGEQKHTLISNTTTKLSGGLSAADAGTLAPDMQASKEELLSIRKIPNAFEMMCFVNNLTPRAIKLQFEYGAVEHAPQLDDAAHAQLRETNRQRLSVPLLDAPKPTTSPEPMTSESVKPQTVATEKATPPPEPDTSDIKPGKRPW